MSAVNDTFPIGGIAPLGGLLAANSNWLPCDGSPYPTKDYAQLFAVLGYTYGGSEQDGTFAVPDYRGYFLRGTDYGVGIDPDVNERTPPPGAKDKDTVGSTQAFATKRPDNPFKASVPHLPTSTRGGHGVTQTGRSGDEGSKTINTCTSGGDGDTRPVNVYVAYYIKAR